MRAPIDEHVAAGDDEDKCANDTQTKVLVERWSEIQDALQVTIKTI